MTDTIKIVEEGRLKPRIMEVDRLWLVGKTGSIAFMQKDAVLYLQPVMFDALLRETKGARAAAKS